MPEVPQATDDNFREMIILKEGYQGHLMVIFGICPHFGNIDFLETDFLLTLYNPFKGNIRCIAAAGS